MGVLNEKRCKNTEIFYLQQGQMNVESSPGILFIKLFPKIAFDVGIKYMRNKNITKQFVKKKRNQVVIEYKML